jgi:2-polyprenyl-3-methyl-5-hydroxy-6-metoxy-1,4-benzoquinol methylase
MFRNNSNRDWEKFGKEDPYFGVLSHDTFRKERLTHEARDAFFATGEEYIGNTFASVGKWLGEPFEPLSAIDFGCGVGRLVIPMAKRCERVVGVDISPSMIAEAAKNAKAFNCENIELPGPLDRVPLGKNFDFVHSIIVFQHIPVESGYALFQNLVMRLKPGGVGVVHFTLTARFTAFRKNLEWLRRRFDFVNRMVNLVRGRPFSTPFMQMNEYDSNRLLDILHKAGCREVTMELTEHHHYLGAILTFRLPR